MKRRTRWNVAAWFSLLVRGGRENVPDSFMAAHGAAPPAVSQAVGSAKPLQEFLLAMVLHQSMRYLFLACLILLASSGLGWSMDDNRGTVGISIAQLFDDTLLPSHRGPIVILQAIEGLPAAKAGVRSGDFVIAVDGVPVPGRELSAIIQQIHGLIGATLRLTVVKPDGSQSEIALVRTPYPPHLNPASDPFSYTVPGSWAADSRYHFPLPWTSKLTYHGSEDAFFSPNFDQTDSAEYHSFLFFFWLDGKHLLSTEQLQSDVLTYFRGIAEERGRNYGFTPDLAKVSVDYKEDSAAPAFGGAPARAFSGRVTIWDTHGKTITLNSEVRISDCGTPDHTAFFFGQSLEPRDGDMWKRIDAIRDTFQCGR